MPPLELSLPFFPHSRPLFSITSRLFFKNRGVVYPYFPIAAHRNQCLQPRLNSSNSNPFKNVQVDRTRSFSLEVGAERNDNGSPGSDAEG